MPLLLRRMLRFGLLIGFAAVIGRTEPMPVAVAPMAEGVRVAAGCPRVADGLWRGGPLPLIPRHRALRVSLTRLEGTLAVTCSQARRT